MFTDSPVATLQSRRYHGYQFCSLAGFMLRISSTFLSDSMKIPIYYNANAFRSTSEDELTKLKGYVIDIPQGARD